jgi:hypothetical protein
MKIITFILAVLLFSVLFSCEKEESEEQKDNTSSSLSAKSHNIGQNCMNCHIKGEEGEGWFKIAGSVYNSTQTVPYITATVELRTVQSGGGILVKIVEVDQNGNFYTTNPIDFGSGLYVSVVGGISTQYMSSKVINGACNYCHDSSKRIWTE